MQAAALLAQRALPRHELWALIEAATGRPREYWIAHDQDPLSVSEQALLERWISRRVQGFPLAYLLGWREFYGRRFWVTPSTLIPRPETELLVDTALAQIQERLAAAPSHSRPLALCELGTGSGCIAVTLALACTSVHVVATDQSAPALGVARNNAAWLGAGGRVEFRLGSWCDALRPMEVFTGIVSNPPYVAKDDAHLKEGDLVHEPASALTDNSESGLEAIRTIAQQALRHLEPGGFLLVEHGYHQQPQVEKIMQQAGFGPVTGLRDSAGLPRAVLGLRLRH